MSDTLRSFVRDCMVEVRVGCGAQERLSPQALLINVICEGEADSRYDDASETSLERVMNYSPVHKFITDELPNLEPFGLLETVAEEIADVCLKNPRVEKVTVKVEKTSIHENDMSVGIELTRAR